MAVARELADFGFASVLNLDRKLVEVDMVCTLDYTAPEIIRNEPNGFEMDIWSCEVILCNLVSSPTIVIKEILLTPRCG